jgi:hypothetical protein
MTTTTTTTTARMARPRRQRVDGPRGGGELEHSFRGDRFSGSRGC